MELDEKGNLRIYGEGEVTIAPWLEHFRDEIISLEVGEDITARVTDVKADGRLSLSIRDKAYLQIEKDAEEVLSIIDSYDGVLPFNDKVSPEIIKRETGMSKNEFKRAVGAIMNQTLKDLGGKIEITEKVIRRK